MRSNCAFAVHVETRSFLNQKECPSLLFKMEASNSSPCYKPFETGNGLCFKESGFRTCWITTVRNSLQYSVCYAQCRRGAPTPAVCNPPWQRQKIRAPHAGIRRAVVSLCGDLCWIGTCVNTPVRAVLSSASRGVGCKNILAAVCGTRQTGNIEDGTARCAPNWSQSDTLRNAKSDNH